MASSSKRAKQYTRKPEEQIQLKAHQYMQLQPGEHIQLSDEECGELVARVRHREIEAFDKLHRFYGTRIHNFLKQVISEDEHWDQHYALDLAQDTFLAAWRDIDKLRDDGAFKPWLFKIAEHKGADWLRKKRLEWKGENGMLAVRIGTFRQQWDVPQQDAPEEQAVQRMVLSQALQRVPPIYRKCIWLRVVEGCRQKEIAQILGIKEKNVSTYVMRAAQKLKRELT